MSDRNLRRLAGKKNARDLAATIHGLKTAAAGLKDILPETQADLQAVQEAIRGFNSGIEYRLDRLEAVFLRHLNDIDRPVLSQEEFDERLLDRNDRYGAEYDAMRFLTRLAMLGGGEDQ